jgi:hypothetical protein
MELLSGCLAMVIVCLVRWIVLHGRHQRWQADTQTLLMIPQHMVALRQQGQTQQQAVT